MGGVGRLVMCVSVRVRFCEEGRTARKTNKQPARKKEGKQVDDVVSQYKERF